MGTGPALATWKTFSWMTRSARSGRPGATGASPASTILRCAYGSVCTWIDQAPVLLQAVGAIRMARGPNRAPGREETPSSKGAPTTATSAPRRASSSRAHGSFSNEPRQPA